MASPLVCLREGTDLKNEAAVADLAISKNWTVKMTIEETQIWYLGDDVTGATKAETIGSVASQVSQYPEVRKNLLAAQRHCATVANGLIAEGRDCGSVVFPNARLKFFLTAHSDSRAQRRASEAGAVAESLLQKGVIVRPLKNYGLQTHLRITAGTQAQNQRCVRALKEAMEALK